MARMPAGEQIIVRPTNNVYTVLVGIALVVEVLGFIALFMAAQTLFPGPNGQPGSLF